MISLRFIVISSLLFFVIASTLFTAFHYKGGNKAGFIATSDEKVSPKKVYVVAAAAAASRENALSGRKMVVDKAIMLKEYAKINVVAREQRTRLKRITYSGNKNVNFVAFTEDYGKPKRHPPKNN